MTPLLPELIPIRQKPGFEPLVDLPQAVARALEALGLARLVTPGMRIGIPAGSRGIAQIPLLLHAVVTYLQGLGAEPVVVASMGSHGGGTCEGQLAVLSALGITASRLGAPVLGGTEAIPVATDPSGEPVWFDRLLANCDGLVVLNRVKPHTSFTGPLESGLTKMLVVGCGKAQGARQFHRLGAAALSRRLRQFGQILLDRLPILGGIAVLEGGRGEIADLVPVPTARWIRTEEALLERARGLLYRLPVDRLDLLVVEQMGKNIAGTGMDTNVIGRFGIRGLPDRGPAIERLVVLDLTPESHGNANGMGLADIITRRLASKVDFPATYLNSLTATFLERAKLPMVMESDREAIEVALRSLGEPVEPRIIRIRNTLELERMLVSPAVLKEVGETPTVQVEGEAGAWGFDPQGNLDL